jgi:hypothetical protein
MEMKKWASNISKKYAMVTDGNGETNLVAMVAVKANSVKRVHIVMIN